MSETTVTVRQLFGTDGIRGQADEYPLDRATTFAVGVALAKWIGTNHLDPEVVIGMDTRESGPWIAEHVAGGLAQGGVRARFAGLISTPGLAHVARTGPFAAGVMISASHNPYHDNGIKIFARGGTKLPDDVEDRIEAAMAEPPLAPVGGEVGRISRFADAEDRYIVHLIESLPHRLDGLRIVLDCAEGTLTVSINGRPPYEAFTGMHLAHVGHAAHAAHANEREREGANAKGASFRPAVSLTAPGRVSLRKFERLT